MQSPWDRSNSTHALLAAFPARMSGNVQRVVSIIPGAQYPPTGTFAVAVQGETVSIPYRIYSEELDPSLERALTGAQRVIARCLYSRHHDGYVRQRNLKLLLDSMEPWVAPFVMQLAGEYVLEILETICQGLGGLAVPGSVERRLYGEFIVQNPGFFASTERRVVSYWTCYYRRKYPEFGRYPGSELMEAFRAAASERQGSRWPRNTPPPFAGMFDRSA
ncbi:hypothetical protein AB0A73_26005 [Glycomyces sp. NPDC047369]